MAFILLVLSLPSQQARSHTLVGSQPNGFGASPVAAGALTAFLPVAFAVPFPAALGLGALPVPAAPPAGAGQPGRSACLCDQFVFIPCLVWGYHTGVVALAGVFPVPVPFAGPGGGFDAAVPFGAAPVPAGAVPFAAPGLEVGVAALCQLSAAMAKIGTAEHSQSSINLILTSV